MAKRLSQSEFIHRAKNITGETNDYSSFVFTNVNDIHVFKCTIHGEYNQRGNHHLNGVVGCKQCKSNRIVSSKEFISSAILIHGDKYSYTKTKYVNAKTKVCITCPIHGDFLQTPRKHLKLQGCPKCKRSIGESKIYTILCNMHIDFKEQYKFSDCKHIRDLLFDFYIPVLNVAIEFDGIQHFKRSELFDKDYDSFINRQKNDSIKNEYCMKNGIKLIRISYKQLDSIDTILFSQLIKTD